jgi:hypothetical protein
MGVVLDPSPAKDKPATNMPIPHQYVAALNAKLLFDVLCSPVVDFRGHAVFNHRHPSFDKHVPAGVTTETE